MIDCARANISKIFVFPFLFLFCFMLCVFVYVILASVLTLMVTSISHFTVAAGSRAGKFGARQYFAVRGQLLGGRCNAYRHAGRLRVNKHLCASNLY